MARAIFECDSPMVCRLQKRQLVTYPRSAGESSMGQVGQIRTVLAGLLVLATLWCSGCGWVATQGPNLGFLAFPIPVSPYFQKEKEDQAWEHERYERVP